MSIPISSISRAAEAFSSPTFAGSAGKAGRPEFGSMLESAIKQVDSYQAQADHSVDKFLAGEGELHTVALATQRADMAFDLGLQVRNKIVSAYQEVMKMQL